MTDTKDSTGKERGGLGWKTKLLICGAILLLGAVTTGYIFSTEPTATRTGATRESAMLVDVADVASGAFQPSIIAMGTVRPAKDIILRPRVSGEIIQRADNFTPGGFVREGEILLRVDPADYRNTLQQRKSELHQAEADFKLAQGRQEIARREYDLLDKKLSPENRALVLREPQLRAAQARVESAQAAVAQAELELERTSITAPFDAHVLARHVNIGSQVSPGDDLGRLVGLNTYWVEATVPLSKLRRLFFPKQPGELGSEVRIRNRTAWPEGAYRKGRLFKRIGELEGQTRMARVLVAVDDPLAYRAESADVPALMIGSFVEVRMEAEEIPDVVRLNRDYVREGDTVWLMEDEKLAIRNVQIDFMDAEYAYIREGLNDRDRVVTTNLSTVVEGVRLRLKESDTAGSQGDTESERRETVQASGETG